MYPEDEMHISFGNCHYPIDWKALKIQRIEVPVAIKLNLDSGVIPFFNRESLTYDERAKSLILSKIKEIANWFVEKYNDSIKEEKELFDCFLDLGDTTLKVKLLDKEFLINDLAKHSDITLNQINVKGLKFQKPIYYFNKKRELFKNFNILVNYTYCWSTKHLGELSYLTFYSKNIIVINVDKIPTGRVRSFLLDKYAGKYIYFVNKTNIPLKGYCGILNLKDHPKSEWRERIKEFQFVQKQFEDRVIDETNVENSKEFLDYCLKKKEEIKEKRKNGTYTPKSNYVRINKTKEDITIQVAVSKSIGTGVKFVKKAVKVADLNRLHKNSYSLHIYFPEENKEEAEQFYSIVKSKHNVCLLSPREFSKLQKINPKQFKTKMEFLKTKSFKKLMTSLKYQEALYLYDEIYSNSKHEIIEKAVENFKKQKNILQKYVKENHVHTPPHLLETLQGLAKENNLYDYEFEDVYQNFLKNIKKYEFVKVLKKPSFYNQEELKVYKNMINSLLLLKSKYNNYENLDIIVSNKTVEEPETIVEEELI